MPLGIRIASSDWTVSFCLQGPPKSILKLLKNYSGAHLYSGRVFVQRSMALDRLSVIVQPALTGLQVVVQY